MKNNKAGFSLVELMVVVSIIAILASIAVPNFSKMSARAKQTAARVELSGIYTSEQSFFAEYSTYHPNLAYIGYVPDGWALGTDSCPLTDVNTGPKNTRYYTVGFQKGGGYSGVDYTFAPIGAPGTGSGGARVANCIANQGLGTEYYVSTVQDTSEDLTQNMAMVSAANAFKAMASGLVNPGGTLNDQWTLDQNKSLTNVQSGI